MAGHIRVETSEGIAVVILDRQEKLNAWDYAMRDELAERLRALNQDASVGAIVITGAGNAFSAGQDLEETMGFTSAEDGRAWFLSWRGFYNAVRHLDKGCVAALNGVAAGSAYQFAMLCDIRVGHAGTRMGQPEINSGIPSVLGPTLMEPRVGLSRTIELTLLGRMMEAEECHHIGLIHYLVEPEQVVPKAIELATELAAKPPIAMRLTKKRFRQMTDPMFAEAFESGAAIEAEAFAAGEPQAAMESFFEKRRGRNSPKE